MRKSLITLLKQDEKSSLTYMKEINSRKYKIQEKLDLGCFGNRLERSQCDLNGNEINLPSSVILPFRERKLLRKQLLLLYVMLKQGKSWFTFEYDNRNPGIANDNV